MWRVARGGVGFVSQSTAALVAHAFPHVRVRGPRASAASEVPHPHSALSSGASGEAASALDKVLANGAATWARGPMRSPGTIAVVARGAMHRRWAGFGSKAQSSRAYEQSLRARVGARLGGGVTTRLVVGALFGADALSGDGSLSRTSRSAVICSRARRGGRLLRAQSLGGVSVCRTLRNGQLSVSLPAGREEPCFRMEHGFVW